jgi:hypothetical protein
MGLGVALRLGARQPRASPWSPPAYQPAKPVGAQPAPERPAASPPVGPRRPALGRERCVYLPPGSGGNGLCGARGLGPMIVPPPVTQKQALQSVMLAKSLIYSQERAGPNLRPRFWSSVTGARSRPVQSRIGLIYLVVLRLLSQLLPPGLAGLGSKMVASGS